MPPLFVAQAIAIANKERGHAHLPDLELLEDALQSQAQPTFLTSNYWKTF
jgi:hypothetical protein